MEKRICISCGKEYIVKYSSYRAKTCSLKCGWTIRKKNNPPKKYQKCAVIDCGENIYAKNLCSNHYNMNLRRGSTIPLRVLSLETRACQICGKIFECSHKSKKILCGNKKCRHDKLSITHKGENNCNWNGGVSQYKNHYEFKKNRLIVLAFAKYKCEKCGKPANHVHHKDENKMNHLTTNLQPLCQKCHFKIHSGRQNKKSKFIFLFGKTMNQLSLELKKPNLYYQYKKKGEVWLKNLIAQNVDQNRSSQTKMESVDAESAEKSLKR